MFDLVAPEHGACALLPRRGGERRLPGGFRGARGKIEARLQGDGGDFDGAGGHCTLDAFRSVVLLALLCGCLLIWGGGGSCQKGGMGERRDGGMEGGFGWAHSVLYAFAGKEAVPPFPHLPLPYLPTEG